MKPNVDEHVLQKQAMQKTGRDKHRSQRNPEIGQQVLVKNFRLGPGWIPGTIAEQLGPITFAVTTDNGQLWKRHVDHIMELGKWNFTEFDQPDADYFNVPTDQERYPQRVCNPRIGLCNGTLHFALGFFYSRMGGM